MINIRFLPEYPSDFVIYETETTVAGVDHRLDAALRFARGKNQRLDLEREPTNEHDPNAIKVFGISKAWFTSRREFVGYIYRSEAKSIVENGFWGRIMPRLRHIWVSDDSREVIIRFDIVGPKKEKRAYQLGKR
jgi:hypothetical protein